MFVEAGTFDDNQNVLELVFDEWTSGNTDVQRVNNLRDGSGTVGGGANGASFLLNAVIDDSEEDELRGNNGNDFFLGQLPEAIDLTGIEFLDD